MDKEYGITIDGSQTIDGERSTVSLFTVGSYSLLPDGCRIVYKESAVTGFDGDETTLELRGCDTVTLMRRGNHNTHLLIQRGKRSACHYEIDGNAFSMGVSEGEIINELGENGGTALFRYSLDIDAFTLCENEIKISVRERKRRK